ncbi:MAG: hypothetical protein QOK37_2358 [Thermoanaerobaculia bacterium]|jgi:hypothetical protein|nr:hypothetical protein [Thermoanaerobaculia bacterium]
MADEIADDSGAETTPPSIEEQANEPMVLDRPLQAPASALAAEHLPAAGNPPRRWFAPALARLVRALWLGSGAFLLLTAAAAFSAASNANDAANVVGAVLIRWHYIALFAPLLLLVLEWRRSRPAMLVILFIAIVLASFQGLLDTRIRLIRMESPVSISSLSPDDPLRRHFGMLHGASSLFLIGQVIAAGIAVAMRDPDL